MRSPRPYPAAPVGYRHSRPASDIVPGGFLVKIRQGRDRKDSEMVFVKILGPGQLTEQRIAEYEERSRGVVQDGKGSDITRLPEGRAAHMQTIC